MILKRKEPRLLWLLDGLFASMIVLFFFNLNRIEKWILTYLRPSTIENFTVIFLSIILEALPFIILGALISSMIQLFVSEQTIARVIPKNKWAGLVAASLIGIVFPVCECAIVPIVRRLMKKGVPVYIGITFMLAVPIVNPIVLLSTYYAFSGQLYMLGIRAGLGIAGAIIIGYLIDTFSQGKEVLKDNEAHNEQCTCGCNDYRYIRGRKKDPVTILRILLEHTSKELYDVGKFLILGAFLSAFMQTFVQRNLLLSIGQGPISSILVMMALAFVLSLCSEADAFIAKTFVGQFTPGAIAAFLILGPMIDVKNTLMLAGSFKAKFVAKLIALIFAICLLLTMWVNIIWG